MTREQIKELIMVILGQADYDLMKAYDPATAEEPEYAEEQMQGLIDTVEKHLKKTSKAPPAKKVRAAKKASKHSRMSKVSRADSSIYLNGGE